jgi:hypothetical protein
MRKQDHACTSWQWQGYAVVMEISDKEKNNNEDIFVTTRIKQCRKLVNLILILQEKGK